MINKNDFLTKDSSLKNLNDSLILTSNFSGNESSSIVMIPSFKIKKEKIYGTLLCLC